ncbi:hypothetical protein N8083_01320 [Candidatus Pacebacteria bacterium]|nr:hypothetical protein [Candidatus Paceibacterota bacterium]
MSVKNFLRPTKQKWLVFSGVFIGIIVISHTLLFAIGELFFYSGIIWIFMPFLGIYGVLTVADIVDVTGRCNEIMCTANALGWVVIVVNIIFALAIYYYIAKKIVHYILNRQKS